MSSTRSPAPVDLPAGGDRARTDASAPADQDRLTADPDRAPAPWWRLRTHAARASVRTKLTLLLAAVTAFALALAGVTSFLLQRASMYERIEDNLRRTVQELQLLSENAVVPETGRPIASASELIGVAMIRTLPVRNEGLLGIEDGRPSLGPNEAVRLRLEEDQELVDWALQLTDSDIVISETVATGRTTYRAAVVPIIGTGMDEDAALLVAFDLDAEIDELWQTYSGYLIAALLAVIVAMVLGALTMRRLLAPLEVLSSTVQRITGTDLSRRLQVQGHDDVAVLGHNVNAMLDRLEASFASQEQLIDDVGHELRTPITIVQGNLEVMDVSDPADVEESVEVSMDELQRMRRLVDDLVTLAKTARPDFVALSFVDVGELTVSVMEKASQLGDRQWQVGAIAEGSVLLDQQRITQAWLQLAANAVRYSEPGTAITVGSVIEGDTLRLWLRDQGVGVAEEDQARIFDRFSRGANVTRTDGSGLGLTIVSAIVAAHQGTVELTSQLGTGSEFSMRLPLRRVGAAAAAEGGVRP